MSSFQCVILQCWSILHSALVVAVLWLAVRRPECQMLYAWKCWTGCAASILCSRSLRYQKSLTQSHPMLAVQFNPACA